MYLRGSKWSMRRRRPRINWFLVVIIVILIAAVTYVDQFILPTAQTPFVATSTPTRNPKSFITDAENLLNEGKLSQSIDTYLEAIRIKPDEASYYIAFARVQVFAGKYDEALVNAENALLLTPITCMAHTVRCWALTQKGSYTTADTFYVDGSSAPGSIQRHHPGIQGIPVRQVIQRKYLSSTLIQSLLRSRLPRQRSPWRPTVWKATGRRGVCILQITDNREQAVQEYLLAIQQNPNISEIHLELGVAYRALGVIDLAIQQYTLANTYNPSDIRPYLYSSHAVAGIGEYAKAAQYAESAMVNVPTVLTSAATGASCCTRISSGTKPWHNLPWQYREALLMTVKSSCRSR